jgi:hypothetical protein
MELHNIHMCAWIMIFDLENSDKDSLPFCLVSVIVATHFNEY